MGCPGPPSAAPWAERNEVGQSDASFKNVWALSEKDVALMGPIADEQSAMAHVLKTAGKARTVVEGLILANVAGLTWHNFDGTVP